MVAGCSECNKRIEAALAGAVLEMLCGRPRPAANIVLDLSHSAPAQHLEPEVGKRHLSETRDGVGGCAALPETRTLA